MNRGREAALPGGTHRRPESLDGLVVTHVNEKGDAIAAYDFSRLAAPVALQRELAEIVADRVRPTGAWRNLPTSKQGFEMLVQFTRWLSEQEQVPARIAEFEVALWLRWRLSLPETTAGRRALRITRMLLLGHPDLSPAVRREMSKRVPRDKAVEQSYSDEEVRQIAARARRVFRQAEQRIHANVRHLADFREGRFAAGTDDQLLGDALDVLADTGDVPFNVSPNGMRSVKKSFARVLGGEKAEHTWQRLYLADHEALAAMLVLACEQGWNFTSINELRVPSQFGSDAAKPLYRVELEKRRRRSPHRYETRTLADDGTRSSGRLLTRVISVTQPARDLRAAHGAPSDVLFLAHVRRFLLVEDRSRLITTGVGDQAMVSWGRETGSRVNFRRLRKAVNVRYQRRPNQNSQDTHDSVYVLTESTTRQDAEATIVRGINAAIRQADAFASVRDTDDAVAEDTATAACTDLLHSPFSPWGVPCAVSFLLCLACPSAVVMPKHLPRLAYLHECLSALRSSVSPQSWAADWAEHYQRLHGLRTEHYSDTRWAKALADVTNEERRLIDNLLRGGLDL